MFMISRFLFGLGNLREWIWVKNSGNYMLQAIRNLYYVGWKLSNKDQNNWKFKNLGKFGVFKSRKMLNYMTGMQNWKLVGKEKKKKRLDAEACFSARTWKQEGQQPSAWQQGRRPCRWRASQQRPAHWQPKAASLSRGKTAAMEKIVAAD